ncbi:hypothetical protein BJ986_002327 [Phycicoccus badiiscoriae]|uniref:Lipoprotein n=1 Tax=Pedococcus badiiscoriae TaxID=642776 RepID=A0A852WGC9_9MICO|nr:hypothetical protein [Pedococcus badiiscoriae]NYG07840.1 hypothetical protein [Pedococcus badiiscoriae]
MSRSTARVAVIGALALALSGCGAGATLAGLHDAPSQVTTVAPISAQSAEAIATRVLAKAAAASADTSADAGTLRAQALTGSALAVANAASRLQTGVPSATTPLVRTAPPKLLGISRGTGWPRLILVQTSTPDSGAVLNLLVSPDARTPFRLSASATMQPGAKVDALNSLTAGSPLLAPGAKLAVQPAELLKGYAASLAFPTPVPDPDVDAAEPFSTGIRAHAADQAKTFGKLATLKQTHTVAPNSTVAIELRGGGALVFGLLERTDTITLLPGGKSLTPSADFQRLVRKKTLTKSAELKSYEIMVFTVPVEGKAQVVAVNEVLFSAKGS